MLCMELPYGKAIPPLYIDIYPREIKTNTPKSHMQMFRAAFFIIFEIQEQLKLPTTDEWINKTQYSHTMEYYPVLQKE